eukprot:403353886
MPSFNRGKYLKESIECILNQTYSNWELLVRYNLYKAPFQIIDNGSSDKETLEIIEQIQNGIYNDQRIRAWKLNSDYGVRSMPRNFGIRYASGDYITFLDDDDLMSYDRLKTAVDIFEANKDVDLVICDITTIDHLGNLIKYEIKKPIDEDLLKFINLFQFTVYFQATIIRNDRLKPYIYNVPMVSQDREMFHRLIYTHKAKIARVPEYQGAYRRHPKQIVLQKKTNSRMWNPDNIVQKVFVTRALPEVFGPDPYYLHSHEQIINDNIYINPNQTVLTSEDKDVYKLIKTESQVDIDRLLRQREVIDNVYEELSCLIVFFAEVKHQMPYCHIKNISLVNEYVQKLDLYLQSRNVSAQLIRYIQQLQRVVRERLKISQVSLNILDEIEQSVYLDSDINRYSCLKPKDIPDSKIQILAHIIEDAEQVKKSIESIKQQSFKNWNLIIMDSQSKDVQSSRQIIETLAKTDQRIQIKQNSDQLVQEIQSEFVAFFNLEGEMLPHSLCIQANYLHFNNHVDVLGGGFVLSRQQLKSGFDDDIVISNQQLRLRQLFGNHISISTLILKSNCKQCINYYISGSFKHQEILFKMMFENSRYFEVLDKQMISLPETSQEYLSLTQNQTSDQQTRANLYELFKKEYSPIDTYMDQDHIQTQLYDALECLVHSNEAIVCAGKMKELFHIYFKKSGIFQGDFEITSDQYNHAYSILKVVDLLSKKNELIDIWTAFYDHSPNSWYYQYSMEQAIEVKILEEVIDLLI